MPIARTAQRPARPDDALAAAVGSFVDVLDYRAETSPDAVVFRMLGDSGVERGVLTFSSLRRRARIIAQRLAVHAAPGDRVAVLVDPGLDYVAAYFGCLIAGVVAVPAYPPSPRRDDTRVGRMLADAGARVALVSTSLLARMAPLLHHVPSLAQVTWLTTEVGDEAPDPVWHGTDTPSASLAMLQYTSGSTAEPRGVMLTHRHLLHNARAIHRVSGAREDDRAVFWLPPFHDMGLIGGILQPVYANVQTLLMTPASFLQRPFRWLEAMSRYGATISGAPNFAYDLCADRVTADERMALDLSSWRVAFNGAEPVRADTISRFLDAFASCGLRRTVFVPCYGLAEATLLVSGGPVGAPPLLRAEKHVEGAERAAALHVASGAPVEDHLVAIVHAETRTRCVDGVVGEIWVQGASVAAGYWNRPLESAHTFGATLVGVDGQFLRTGDLGFVSDGYLFVTGRLKDLIILRGRNYYPQDIERAAEQAHAHVRRGHCVAFTVADNGQARLVVVAEVSRRHRTDHDRAVCEAIRASIAEQVGLLPDMLVLAHARAIPRTSSGKPRREESRRAWQEGRLVEVARWNGTFTTTSPTTTRAATPELTDRLRTLLLEWLADELSQPVATLDPARPLADYGVESLAVLRLQVVLEQQLGRGFDARVLWEAENIEALVQRLADSETHVTRLMDEAAVVRADSNDIARWPEYRALQDRREALADAQLTEPFFWVHDAVAGAVTQLDGRAVTNFASYNYLGLSGHPDVTRAAHEALSRWGTSVSASRLVSGERAVHRLLERALAEFVGMDDALTFVGGHATNVSTITHLVGAGDLVCCDERLHNSGMQGAHFSGADCMVFPHNDWRALDAMLSRSRAHFRRALVLIESVYSADGDAPELAPFVDVKQRHDALLMVDEAHGLGVLGATGRGLAEACGVSARSVDISMGTLSKSLASCGGYIAGSAALIEYLRYTCPGFVFSVGMPPASAAAAHAALVVLREEPSRVEQLRARSARFRARARAAMLDIGDEALTAIVPVVVGDSERAIQLTWALRARGIHVQPMVAPAVPEHAARLRFFLSCEHSETQIDDAVNAVAELLHSEHGVLRQAKRAARR
ncbi:MAG: aminotransferase class I/II-fold pyridoxal phosphate-dependent enzyme [Gemmatimonadaceae bacterium]|nr:aminotransferase class I/II-fold pyridoxal phosphate-dependent enzyme [Gemmatimonadaceae bacterium]